MSSILELSVDPEEPGVQRSSTSETLRRATAELVANSLLEKRTV